MTRSDPEQDPLLAEMERVHAALEAKKGFVLAPYFPTPGQAYRYHMQIAQEAACTECSAYLGMPCKLWLGYEAVHGSRLAAGEARMRILGTWVDPPWWGTRTAGL